MTIFARGDSAGVVSSRELFILWSQFLEPCMWLMDHFDKVTTCHGEIAIGGMISVIVLSFGVDFTDHIG